MSKHYEHKDILNRLHDMQQSPYYATACHDLIKAEMAIVQLSDERDALKADAARYRAIRSGLEVDENSRIVVSVIDDFGGETLRNEHADESIDAAMGAKP